MQHSNEERRECELRLEAARDMVEMSSALFSKVAFGDVSEAIESAYAELRLARVRFLTASAAYREVFS